MSSPHPARRFSSPLGSGPGRFLSLASALSEELKEDKIEFPSWNRDKIKEIHEHAKHCKDEKRLIGPLEQYVRMNSRIRECSSLLSRRFDDFYIVFVTGVSTDIVAKHDEVQLETGYVPTQDISSAKMGFSFYSDSNAFSTKLIELEMRLEESLERICPADFEGSKKKPRLYIPIGPFIAAGYVKDKTLRDVMLEDISEGLNLVDDVNSGLEAEGKGVLGDMQKSRRPSFQNPLYRFSECFFDGKKAERTLRLPDGKNISDFRKECSANTFYTRLVASYMYKSVIDMIKHQDEFLVVASKSSYAMKIIERALRLAGKRRLDINIMEGTFIPLDGEANRTAISRIGGYFYGRDTGKRKSLSEEEFFGRGR